MTATHWGAEHEAALRRIFDKDLPDTVGCYLYAAEDLPDSFAMTGQPYNGYQSDVLDLHLQSRLQAEGRYRGRGFTCVLRREDRSYFSIFDIALHELAHYLSEPDAQTKTDPTTWPRSLQFLQVASINLQCKIADIMERGNPQPDLWAAHGTEFILAGLAVCHRARRAGVLTSPDDMQVAGRTYGLSSGDDYYDSVRDELERRRDDPISQIMRDPAPKALVALFESDVETHRRFSDPARKQSHAERMEHFSIWKRLEADSAERSETGVAAIE